MPQRQPSNPSGQGYEPWISYIIYQASRLNTLLRPCTEVCNKGQGTAELGFYLLSWHHSFHSESLSKWKCSYIRFPNSQMVWNSSSNYIINLTTGRQGKKNLGEFSLCLLLFVCLCKIYWLKMFLCLSVC